MTWRPISTAPRTGNDEILTHGPAGYRIVRWNDDAYAKKPRPFWTWWSQYKSLERETQPTHWMPLPEPPTP